MTRWLFFALIMSTGVFLNSPTAVASLLRCEDQGVTCLGGCADRTGGAGDLGGRQNKCLLYCSRRVSSCMIRDAMIRR